MIKEDSWRKWVGGKLEAIHGFLAMALDVLVYVCVDGGWVDD